MTPLPPHIRRRRKDALAGQVLGVRVRMAETSPPRQLNMTLPRQRLMQGVERGEVKPGTGRYAGGYRWHHGNGDSETVTVRVCELMAAQWAVKGETHVELTEAGRQALTTGGTP